MKLTQIAKLRGYTAQARYYAQYFGQPDGSWKGLGWTRLDNGAVKPVFQHAKGQPVIVLDGTDHLSVVIYAIDPQEIRANEDDCYTKS